MTANTTANRLHADVLARTSADGDRPLSIGGGHPYTSMDVMNAVFKTGGSDRLESAPRESPSRTATQVANGGIWR